jgi:hypothetical protein
VKRTIPSSFEEGLVCSKRLVDIPKNGPADLITGEFWTVVVARANLVDVRVPPLLLARSSLAHVCRRLGARLAGNRVHGTSRICVYKAP